MMQVLRKHQKIIFLCTTIVVVISFVFFGTYNSLLSFASSKVDKAYPLLEGRASSLKKLEGLKIFISTSAKDAFITKDPSAINILNDGVIEREFLAAPLGRYLFTAFQEHVAEDTMQSYEKAYSHRGYAHPSDPSLSVERVFSHFEPGSSELLARLHQKQKPSPVDAFSILSELCVKQRKVPKQTLRRALEQEMQKKGMKNASFSLDNVSLELCGATALGDWIGQSYIDLCAQCIMHFASYAKAHGIKFSSGEAKKQLLINLQKQLKQITGKEVEGKDLHNVYLRQLAMLRIDEELCLDIYKDILCFTRLIASATEQVKGLELLFEEKKAKAMQYMQVERYDAPKIFEKLTLESMLKLQIYLEMLAPSALKKEPLALAEGVPALSDVEKRHPELVHRSFLVSYASLSRSDILCQIPMKKIIDWQLEEKNWPALIAACSELSAMPSSDGQKRLESIDALGAVEKLALDRLAQEALLREDIDMVRKLVTAAAKKTANLSVDAKGKQSLIPSASIKLLQMLSSAALQGEMNSTIEAIAAAKALQCYSDDGSHFYSIQVISRDTAKRLLTFEEVEKMGLLDELLAKKMEMAYSDAVRKEPLLFGNAPSFALVRGCQELAVAKAAFPELFKAIEQRYTKHFSLPVSDEKKDSPSFYTTFRLLPYILTAKQSLENKELQSHYFLQDQSKSYQTDWQRQWLFTKRMQKISLIDRGDLIAAKALDVEHGALSDVVMTTGGALTFFKVLEKASTSSLPEEEIEKIRTQLSQEAKRKLTMMLIEKVASKKLIASKTAKDGSL